MRIGAGAVLEDLVVDEVGTVAVAYQRAADGWVAEFTVTVSGVPDLAVVHRLHAPTLAAARQALPSAAAFLAGHTVKPAAPLG